MGASTSKYEKPRGDPRSSHAKVKISHLPQEPEGTGFTGGAPPGRAATPGERPKHEQRFVATRVSPSDRLCWSVNVRLMPFILLARFKILCD